MDLIEAINCPRCGKECQFSDKTCARCGYDFAKGGGGQFMPYVEVPPETRAEKIIGFINANKTLLIMLTLMAAIIVLGLKCNAWFGGIFRAFGLG